jgi:hypothetical protein
MRQYVRGLRVVGIFVLSLLLTERFVEKADGRDTVVRPRLGINLAGPVDWGTELPFVDVFHFSRPWISQRKGAAFGKGPALDLDQHGWVKKLEPGCYAETLLCTIKGGHYPSGIYTVLYEGEGRIEFGGAATVVASKPGRMQIRVNPERGGIFLKLTATNPKKNVRNIRVIMPGFEKTYKENPWHPKFLERWQGIACVRYMDFMKTNNSTISSWSDRPTPDDATFASKGVPVELLVDLANRLKADPWFCMPHKANDEYVRNFAEMVKKSLAKDRKVYIEYSNEVWNTIFSQYAYASEQGKKLGFADKPWEAAWRYTAYRSVQIFTIWEKAFGGMSRLVRVLPSQASNSFVSKQIAGFQNAYKHADALAIAPYLSFNVSPKSTPPVTEVAGWSVDQLMSHLEKQSLPQSVKWIRDSKSVAKQYGLKLIAYEGGQHMVGIFGAENNEALTKLLFQANSSSRLGDIYRQYFDAWQKEGGDLFCYFSSVSEWSKFGSWGIFQYYDEAPANSPKCMAVLRWARSHGQRVKLPE